MEIRQIRHGCKVKAISFFFMFSNDVDITGNSTLKPDEEPAKEVDQTLLEKLSSCNPCFSSLEGNPHSKVVQEEE